MRTAIRQSSWVTFGVLAAALWIILTIMNVASAFNWGAINTADYIGTNAVGGIVGLAVMLVFLGLLVVLYGELTETEPGPSTWPPQ